MSWIQNAALLYLLRHDQATIKAMKPRDVDANLFAYHLEKLQAEGYVRKTARGVYSLTTKGQRYVGAMSTETSKVREFIKTVVVLYSKHPDGRFLLFRWSRQPYLGKVGLLHDHMPLGTSLEDGIASALQDKLGGILPTTYRMTALIKIQHDGELVSHMNALIYEVNPDSLLLPSVSRNGTAFWGTPIATDGAMEGLQSLIDAIATLSEPAEYTLEY